MDAGFCSGTVDRGARTLFALLLLCALGGAATVATAQEPVAIVHPGPDGWVFGRAVVMLEIAEEIADQVELVEVLLDDETVARLRRPPWQARFDAGSALGPRQLEARVRLADGRVLIAQRTTAPVRADDEVAVRLVNLGVVVNDRHGTPLHGLTRADFEIRVDGERVDIARFSNERAPLSLMLVLDVSESMAGERLAAAQVAAVRLVGQLEPTDELGLLVFDDEVRPLVAPTTDRSRVLEAVGDLTAQGGTALYDAVYETAAVLGREAGHQRRVIILVSDGRDAAERGWTVASLHTLDGAVRHAHRHDVSIYAIGLGENLEYEPSIDRSGTTADVLARLARSTGGAPRRLARATDLSVLYDDILAELRTQYSLAFTPPDLPGADEWRPIEVRVDRRKAKVRTRAGYYSR
jgi:Ca-activated chloride channel family protein